MNRKKIRDIINKYEKKKDINSKDVKQVNKHIEKLELHGNLVSHFISRFERIKLRLLEE